MAKRSKPRKSISGKRGFPSFAATLAHLRLNDRDPEQALLQLLASVDGKNTDADRVFVRDCIETATRARVADGVKGDEPIRSTRNSTARGILELIVRQLARLKRGKSGLIVVGKDAFTGKQYRETPRPKEPDPTDFEEVLAQYEREMTLEASGVDVPQAKRKRARVSVPKGKGESEGQQGGLAMELGRCTKTVLRWAKVIAAGDIMRLSRVPSGSTDAILPHRGARVYPYPKWSLLREPPSGLLSALRVLWGERLPRSSTAKVTRPSSAERPPRTPQRAPELATGPPVDPFAYDADAVAAAAAAIAALTAKHA